MAPRMKTYHLVFKILQRLSGSHGSPAATIVDLNEMLEPEEVSKVPKQAADAIIALGSHIVDRQRRNKSAREKRKKDNSKSQEKQQPTDATAAAAARTVKEEQVPSMMITDPANEYYKFEFVDVNTEQAADPGYAVTSTTPTKENGKRRRDARAHGARPTRKRHDHERWNPPQRPSRPSPWRSSEPRQRL